MHHDVKVKYFVSDLSFYFFLKVLWERVKVAIGHPDFAEKLLAFVVAYNAKHL